MADTAPTDNGSIQGDTWHDYIGNAADNTWAMAGNLSAYTSAIAAL